MASLHSLGWHSGHCVPQGQVRALAPKKQKAKVLILVEFILASAQTQSYSPSSHAYLSPNKLLKKNLPPTDPNIHLYIN
jgi:hypothetical protein